MVFLPNTYQIAHVLLWIERQYYMKVIGHQHEESTIPITLFLIVDN